MTDPQTQIRMQLLAKDADIAVVAFCHAKSDRFILLPLEDYGSPNFTAAVAEAMTDGFVMLALIALRSTPEPLIEDEAMPGASDESVQKARQLFQDQLLKNGLLRPDSQVQH